MSTVARFLLLLGVLLPRISWAVDEHANLMLIPTRVVMHDSDLYASVIVKNSGQATGNFSVGLIDMQMQETGNIVPVEEGKKADYSAIPYVHVAPRSMTLKPGEMQNVRLILSKKAHLEDGEYRAHLKVRIVDENVDDIVPSVVSTKQVSIVPKAHLVLIIPVIFRHGDTSLTMRIDMPRLSHDASGASKLDMYLVRSGNCSSMGDISVNYVSVDGKSQLLNFSSGIPVYRPTPRRFISIPLDVPKSISLSRGSLRITYAERPEEGGKVLAEKTVNLGALELPKGDYSH
jgi:hypothetical protein